MSQSTTSQDDPQEAGSKSAIQPTMGEVITSLATGNSYTIGEQIGEGNFGIVYACEDVWHNSLAAKVLKPVSTYEKVRTAAEAEFIKLLQLRNPFITFVYDAFEYRNTFYIITERCYCPTSDLFPLQDFNGLVWILPIARCLLQAVHYLHVNNYVHQDIHHGNVFATFIKDEMSQERPEVIQFKLGDLGVARVLHEVDAENTRAQWMLPPEVVDTSEFGPIDSRVDIYHIGLFFLQLAYSTELRFTEDEIINGAPRKRALSLPEPYNFALEKTLRRHAIYRTASAMEIWKDFNMHEQLKEL